MFYQLHNSITQYYFECIRYRNFNYDAHMHRHPEIVYVRKGSVLLKSGSNSEIISAGEFGWIPSNCIHSYENVCDSVVDVCIVSEDYIPSFAKEINGKTPDKAKFTCRNSVKWFVDAELFSADKTPDFYTLKSVMYAMVGEIISQISFETISTKNDILINNLVKYVSENFTNNINLKTAASVLGYEEHYLSRCFHDLIPMHFSKYVNLYRLDTACMLFQHTDLSVSEVAMQSGFQSLRTFNRAFRDFTGKSPSDFIKNKR